MFGLVISPVHFGLGLFHYSNFLFFSILTLKKKQICKFACQKQSLESLIIRQDI